MDEHMDETEESEGIKWPALDEIVGECHKHDDVLSGGGTVHVYAVGLVHGMFVLLAVSADSGCPGNMRTATDLVRRGLGHAIGRFEGLPETKLRRDTITWLRRIRGLVDQLEAQAKRMMAGDSDYLTSLN
jgi:ATP-dependent protease ClpP protease subunit